MNASHLEQSLLSIKSIKAELLLDFGILSFTVVKTPSTTGKHQETSVSQSEEA